jgi:hypothetical protein
MSPVEIWGMFRSRIRFFAWVPFPDPGAPNKIMRISTSLSGPPWVLANPGGGIRYRQCRGTSNGRQLLLPMNAGEDSAILWRSEQTTKKPLSARFL